MGKASIFLRYGKMLKVLIIFRQAGVLEGKNERQA
jgi:hypothetical protein